MEQMLNYLCFLDGYGKSTIFPGINVRANVGNVRAKNEMNVNVANFPGSTM